MNFRKIGALSSTIPPALPGKGQLQTNSTPKIAATFWSQMTKVRSYSGKRRFSNPFPQDSISSEQLLIQTLSMASQLMDHL